MGQRQVGVSGPRTSESKMRPLPGSRTSISDIAGRRLAYSAMFSQSDSILTSMSPSSRLETVTLAYLWQVFMRTRMTDVMYDGMGHRTLIVSPSSSSDSRSSIHDRSSGTSVLGSMASMNEDANRG